eukprot:4648619-Amphidinium_carterae.1
MRNPEAQARAERRQARPEQEGWRGKTEDEGEHAGSAASTPSAKTDWQGGLMDVPGNQPSPPPTA